MIMGINFYMKSPRDSTNIRYHVSARILMYKDGLLTVLFIRSVILSNLTAKSYGLHHMYSKTDCMAQFQYENIRFSL